MLYVIGIVPTLLTHHHHDEPVIFSEASACEKAIHYGVEDNHKQHISETAEKCLLCDNHTVTPQLLFEIPTISLPQPTFYTAYFSEYKSYHFLEVTTIPNKGPPSFV